jgi:hypothetical protein
MNGISNSLFSTGMTPCGLLEAGVRNTVAPEALGALCFVDPRVPRFISMVAHPILPDHPHITVSLKNQENRLETSVTMHT